MDTEDKMAKRLNSIGKGAFVAALIAAGSASPASARTEVSPYLEVNQVMLADLKDGGDVLTYTSAAAGLDVNVTGNRAELQLNYRYEHRFSWDKGVPDDDIHSGLARGRIDVVPNMLSLEAGALATRTRTDLRGESPTQDFAGINNVSQIYSAYAGPSFATNVGPVDVAASYRLGYTRVDGSESISLPTGQDQIRGYDDSVSHYATASVGMEPGTLPFGWTVTGAYEREKVGSSDQVYEGKGVRGDIVFPVTNTVALVGGAGYEDIRIREGAPSTLAYREDGIYWDAGVLWQPSDRTSFEARVGRRYGSMSYTGSFTWQPARDTSLSVAVFDDLSTFGQQLNDNLSRLPTQFGGQFNGLGNNLGGCVFTGGAAAGGCFNPALQSINDAAFRSRGVVALWSAQRGRFSYGLGGGYVQRKYVTPLAVGLTNLTGVKDESIFAQGFAQYQLTRRSSIEGDVYANWSNSGIAGAPSVFGTGATGTYSHSFGRFSATAQAGVYSFEQKGFQSDLTASALLGMRYQF
jgi:hypothetical protein